MRIRASGRPVTASRAGRVGTKVTARSGEWLGHARALHRSRRVALVVLTGTIVASAVSWRSVAFASTTTDRNKISVLEQKIASQGAQVQTLVSKYNAVEIHLESITAQIARNRTRLISDKQSASKASIELRTIAVDAYVNAESGDGSKVSNYTGSGSASTTQEKNVYSGVAGGTLDSAVATLEGDQERISDVEVTLRLEQVATAAILSQLSAARDTAEAALNADDATLRQVKGNLLTLINQAAERRQEAQEAAAEEAIAAAAAQQQSSAPAPTPTAPTVTPAPGSYANPLRGLRGIRPERIDQGVDYGGFGPVYAIGDGRVISTVDGGWPGGAFISYQLTDGPASGLTVYVAEDIYPRVQVGQSVTSNTVVGQAYEGSYGIETGWADDRGDGTTMASDYSQYGGGNSTAFGYNFSQLLRSLGAAGGILESAPAGSLPAGWPRW